MAKKVKLRRGLPVTEETPDYPELDTNNQVKAKNVKTLVPYTGATRDVDLGVNSLSAAKVSGGTPDTMVVNGTTVDAQIEANSDVLGVVESHTHNSAPAAAATFYHARSRGTTAAPTAVQNGDLLGIFAAVGFDGTDYATGGYIIWAVSGAPGSNDMPTEFSVWTSPDGSQTPVKNFSIGPTGAAAFTADATVPDEAYGAGWNGSLEVPTKNAVYDKIETLQPAGSYLTAVTADSPLSGSGTSGSHLVIADAAADGSTKGAAAFNATDFTASSGVISSTAKYNIPMIMPSITPVTWTTSTTNLATVFSSLIIPRTGTYRFRFNVKIITVSGTPSTITFTTNAATALSRCPANSTSASYATLIAANTTVATAAKGSTFVAGDCYYGESSGLSLTAGDSITCGTANTQLFTAKVNNATNVTAVYGITLVEQ